VSALRVDLHPRDDGANGPGYDETPSRWLVVRSLGTSWSWEVRERFGLGSTIVDSGPAEAFGPPGARTSIRAVVPTDAVAAAAVPAPGSLSPLALRACTGDEDCGPNYGSDPLTDPDHAPTPGTDYLPDPVQYPVTFPSVCQHPAGAAATEVTAGPGAAKRLGRAGWVPIGPLLPDGTVRFRGSVAAARALGAVVTPVPTRRASVIPSDPRYRDPPGSATGQWNLRRVGATRAWDATTGDAGLTVGMVDGGIDALHPDLAGRATAVRDFVAARERPAGRDLPLDEDTDVNGHGSAVASLVAAATDDGIGMAGLGWRTRLVVARVFDAEGCASDAAITQAMDWAVDQGAAVVNLSLGGTEGSLLLRDAGQRALDAGVLVVAAAGNHGRGAVEYPAAYEEFVSVGATGYAEGEAPDHVASYSSTNEQVDLAAPGGSGDGTDEHDALVACWVGPTAGRGYCHVAGTSFAAPLVSATVALARELDPDRTPEGLVDLLTDTARDISNGGIDDTTEGRDEASGAGLLRANTALLGLAGRRETIGRIAAEVAPSAASVAVSRATFADDSADHVLLARDDLFADSLAAAPLGRDDGPMLLTPTHGLRDEVGDEIARVLAPGGRVYLLGGEAALAPAVADAIGDAGFEVERVAGPTRIETAVAIADRLHPASRVLVASAADWPDAVAGGAYAAETEVPLLLVWPDDPARSPATFAALERLAPSEVIVLGGPGAITDPVVAAIAARWPVRRVAGPTRFATAVAVATDLWARTQRGESDRYVVVDGDSSRGWAYGLMAASLSAREDAPLLLVNDGFTTDEPHRFLHDTIGYRVTAPATATVVGPVATTAGPTVQRLRELLGG